ncbi:MAG: hypothetical protein QM654_04360 [Dysgonamonadaceae bacterium]
MTDHLIQALVFSAPMFTALFCCLFSLIHYFSRKQPHSGKPVVCIAGALFSATLCWLGTILFLSGSTIFVYYNTLFLLALMLYQVFLYHFVSTITGTDNKPFLRTHYLIPFFITPIMGLWPALVPPEVKTTIAAHLGNRHPHDPLLSIAASSFTFIFCVYNLLYATLGVRRVRKYRQEIVNDSADSAGITMRCLYLFIILILSSIPIPFATLFTDRETLIASRFTMVAILLPIIQYILLTYNLLADNNVLIEPPTAKNTTDRENRRLNRKRFEKYIRKEKPFLNPKLKITDVALDLYSNRSYVSAFINQEYGKNFNCYINSLRLAELDRLRTLPQNKKYSHTELLFMAGFSDYRGYLRAKNEADKSGIMGL